MIEIHSSDVVPGGKAVKSWVYFHCWKIIAVIVVSLFFSWTSSWNLGSTNPYKGLVNNQLLDHE